MKIGIIGYGHIGQLMKKLFVDAIVYDEPLQIGCRDDIRACDAVFICVPTPANADGSCDTSIVESVIAWQTAPLIIIRSTVWIGFTDQMMERYKKEIVFQPEYYGETVAHPFSEATSRTWLAFGGRPQGINLAIQVYQQVINSNIRIFQADAKSVELAKYMDNAFLAAKVTFCNEMFDIAKALGADYNLSREIFTADPRIGTSHTFVYEDNRGFGGSCLPKDVSSLVFQADQLHVNTDFLKALISKNQFYRSLRDE